MMRGGTRGLPPAAPRARQGEVDTGSPARTRSKLLKIDPSCPVQVIPPEPDKKGLVFGAGGRFIWIFHPTLNAHYLFLLDLFVGCGSDRLYGLEVPMFA